MATEDELRGRYAEAAADWAYMHPISNGGLAEGEEAVRLATTWGEQITRYLTESVRDEEMERAHGEIGRLGNRVKALEALGEELRRQRDKAEAAVERERQLHVRNVNTGDCEYCSERDYPDYAVPWPCDSIAALDAPAEAHDG
ncbi:MAG TPA: hypothetical protein VE172_08080 [Stackebrandtia sp.]|uniref:hypothetical protein n=1 Tax=Stackebrandtia sp. TaxID=2023065 RepID=UPI002D44B05D|nr:hypothetical protein [Stackebrandtia sp.]HZE38756.1 hypothetical protein [Stackebrandtia sp.]